VRRLAAVGSAVALVVLGAAASCGEDTAGIRTAEVGRATVTEVVDAPASVTARAVATVTSPAAGRLAKLYVTDGTRVDAGDVLAVVDSPEARQRLEQANRALASVQGGRVRAPGVDLSASARQTDAAAAQAFAAARAAAEALVDPRLRAAALARVDAAEAQYAAASRQARDAAHALQAGLGSVTRAVNSLTAAQRVQAEAAVELAQAGVDALTLRTPVGGTVQLGGTSAAPAGDLSGLLAQLPPGLAGTAGGAAGGSTGGATGGAQGGTSGARTDGTVAAGSAVAAGTAVATVVDVSALGLVAEVDETDVLLVTPGVAADVELDAVPGGRYPATVRAVDLTPTTSSRGGVGYRVRLSLGAGTLDSGDEAAPTPRPGMSAVARLRVRTARDAVALPVEAVVAAGGRDTVWVVQGGEARRRTIRLGTQGTDMVEVTSGLRTGERVVVRGADRVDEGQELP